MPFEKEKDLNRQRRIDCTQIELQTAVPSMKNEPHITKAA